MTNNSSKDEPVMSYLRKEIAALRAENKKLKAGLDNSERLRRDMENKFTSRVHKMDSTESLEKVMKLEWTRSFRDDDGEQTGIIWNLTHLIDDISALNNHLAEVNHASRNGIEVPIVITSQRELNTVSYLLSL